ncbi:hypothetical protein L228DRAFT_240398 [Xylona heveae TC161]|uniref:DUF7587 domain-containing protein n=1 Tax=Xylona heveae (strain CBS 132557 / TC161) TaxID=1328760 RepID=A0A165AK74_XYLHT|nr:hypothetical protein L228DRAFT_240398 [Xylona heveae TC161]KZF20618.1 hypothetical protein L228DRAFT_240398 [Xylona heveae TC161]
MDQFRVPQEQLDQLRPRYLWRVQHPGCQTEYIEGQGLYAQDTDTFYKDDQRKEFGQSVENNLSWHSRVVQPYIALFSEQDHAVNWIYKLWSNQDFEEEAIIGWTLFKIDSRELEDVYVFKFSTVVKKLGLRNFPRAAGNQVSNCYIALHSIPDSAIEEIIEAAVIIRPPPPGPHDISSDDMTPSP